VHFVLLVFAFMISASQTYLFDGLRRDEKERIGKMLSGSGGIDWPMCSYVFWSLGAVFWLLLEYWFEDDWVYRIRIFTAFLLVVSMILFLVGMDQAKQKGNMLLMLAH